MTQDFAGRHRSSSGQAAPFRFRWFASGFFCGAFAALLASIFYLSPKDEIDTRPAPGPVAKPASKGEEIQWGFFEMFPTAVVPVVEEYLPDGSKVTDKQVAWILQTGSFKNRRDADKQRAELILETGLDVAISEVTVAGVTWYRLIAGPFNTETARNRAQDKIAQAEIESFPIEIPR